MNRYSSQNSYFSNVIDENPFELDDETFDFSVRKMKKNSQPKFCSYDELEDEFESEIKRIIDKVFAEKISASQKEELVGTFLSIFSNYAEELSIATQKRNSIYGQCSPNNFPTQLPIANLIYFNPQLNSMNPQNYGTFNPANLIFNPYQNSMYPMPQLFFNYSSPYQIQAFQPPPLILPQLMTNYGFNLNPFQIFPNTQVKPRKKHKKWKKEKKEKNEKKEKKEKEEKEEPPKPAEKSSQKEFSPNPSNPFDGIINYLRRIGEINDVVVSSSSSLCLSYIPENVIDYEGGSVFESGLEDQNPWLCIMFKSHKVILKNYTMKSGRWDSNEWNPRNWAIEGSNDNMSWDLLDNQIDCQHLNGCYRIHTFPIQNQKDKEYRYIRIRKTGNNWLLNNPGPSNMLVFDSIEFYGTLI